MNLHSFLGFEFSAIRLDDLNILADFLRRYPQPLSGYTFATLAAWHPFFHYGWAFAEPETLLISCALDTDVYPRLLQPIGRFSPELAQKLLKSAGDLPHPLKISGVCARFLQENSDFVKYFAVEEDRAGSNYLYRAKDLANLAGRKYAKKRNLLSQASNLYAWSIQDLTSARTKDCFLVLATILKEERPRMERMLAREWSALECTLRHFDLFNQRGLIVSVEGRAVAFSIYEAIGPATVAVHFERALRSYKGLYQVVNWETAKVIDSQGFEFINREEDLGDPGLRKAKMSYNPLQIVPAYELTFKK